MNASYRFLDFRFKRFGQYILLVNDIGEYQFLQENEFKSFVNKRLDTKSDLFLNLQSKHMAVIDHIPQVINFLATAYRTKKRYLYDFTSLHMFVVTHRCNQNCTYCHASSINDNDNTLYDMSPETGKKCVDVALKSPSKNLKFEFQGGEPLLNFEVIKEIVEYTKNIISSHSRRIDFVVCTNLTKLKEEHLLFFKQNKISISTSLDGPKEIHDQHRKKRNGDGSHELVKKNINWASEYLYVIVRNQTKSAKTR